MIENIRAHPYTRAVCLETARLFEQRAAEHLVESQEWADQGAADSALEFQTKARLAQQRANAWHLRARNASNQTACVTAMSVIDIGELRADIPKTGQRSRSE
jgi:hypothetical protein